MCVWHVQGDLQGLPPQYKITPKDDKHRRNPSLPLLTLSNTIQPPSNPLQPPNNLQHPPNSLLRSTSIPLRGEQRIFGKSPPNKLEIGGATFLTSWSG